MMAVYAEMGERRLVMFIRKRRWAQRLFRYADRADGRDYFTLRDRQRWARLRYADRGVRSFDIQIGLG
jgi:hypothetical protein